MKKPEEIFYTKINKSRKSLKNIEQEYFSTGKRYSIINNVLNKDQKYDLLVEAGAGQTGTLNYLEKKFKFNKLVGFDLAKFNKENSKKIRYIKANFNYKLPLKNNTVDCFIAMMVIEHLFDPFHSFAEIRRILKKNGFAFVNLPLVTSLKNRLRLLFGNIPETSVNYDRWFKDKEWDGNHLHYFTLDSINKICLINKLKIVKLAPVGKYYFIKKIFPSLFCNEISFCVKKI